MIEPTTLVICGFFFYYDNEKENLEIAQLTYHKNYSHSFLRADTTQQFSQVAGRWIFFILATSR